MAFARLGKRPPRLRIAAVHKGHDRHENVYHAEVVAAAGGLAKLFIQFERIAAYQLFGFVYADQPQILGAGLADIRQVFEFDCTGSVDFLRMHEGD